MLSWKALTCGFVLILIQNAEGSGQYRHSSPGRARYYCPPEFVRLGNGCYFFSSFIASWQNAHFACRDRNAQLISMESRWEDSTIRSYLSRPEFARLERWIGGLYDWNQKQWLWGATGQPMTFAGFGENTSSRFLNWHCVYMDPEQAHKWNHKLCTKNLHYICKTPLVRTTVAPIPSTANE